MLLSVQLAILTAYVSFSGQIVDTPAPSLDVLEAAARAAQQSGDYNLAAEKYRAILMVRPDLTEARFNFGLMLHLAGKYSEAAANLKQVLQRDPNFFPANLLVGIELLRMQQADQAIPFLEHARKLKPGDEQVSLNLAQAELLVGKFEEAYVQFANLTRGKTNSSDAWYGLGLSSLGEMRVSLQQLWLHSKDSVYAKLLLGRSYAERGYWKQADTIYTGLLAFSDPKCIASSLGFVRWHEGDAIGAEKLFRQDLQQGCSAAATWLDRVRDTSGHSALKTATTSPAEETGLVPESDAMPEPVWKYEECNEAFPIQSVSRPQEQQAMWLHAVACASREQDYEKALKLLRARLAVTPGDLAALYWKARTTRNVAFSSLAQVAKMNPGSMQLHLLLGHILLDQEKVQSAEEEYRKVLEQDPSAMQARMGIAVARYRSRDFENAIPELQKVLLLAPLDSKANYLLGSILVFQQQYDQAKPYLIQAEKSASANDIAPIRARLAEAYAQTGDIDHAIHELQRCLPVDLDGRYHYRISLLYRKLGNRSAAEAALRRYSELRSNSQTAESMVDVQ